MAVVELKEFKNRELDLLSEFLSANSPDHPEVADKNLLLWTRCFRFISRSKEEIVGYIAQIPQIFRYGKSMGNKGLENIGWSVTLVLKDFGDVPDAARRRTAYTHELLSKVEKNPPWQFAAVGVVPEIEEFYRIRGHNVRRDCVKMYSRFLVPSKMLYYLKRSGGYSLPIKVLNKFHRGAKSSHLKKVNKVVEFNPNSDGDWDSILSSQYDLYGERTAEYLNYKLSQPNKKYMAYVHSDCGYIVFRFASHFVKDLKIVKICDLVGTEPAKYDLVSIAVEYAKSINAYGIVAIGSVKDEAFYRKCGLYISRPYVVTLSAGIISEIYVNFFDADLDNLW